jgi:hypothetical protein
VTSQGARGGNIDVHDICAGHRDAKALLDELT